MRQVDEQINISNKAICDIIDKFDGDERGFISQNILNNLRTFVEAVSVKISGKTEYSYVVFRDEAKNHIQSVASLKFLNKFHESLQKTLSHYLPDKGNSERLMLKYYEYLLKTKSFLKRKYNFDVLENIDKFPITVDPILRSYHKKISEKISEPLSKRVHSTNNDRYYIKKKKSFFVDHEVYYEVTFTVANDNVSKFDSVIAFTKLDILPNYAVKFSLSNTVVDALGKKMPIQIIDSWEVSIRPCELQNFMKIFNVYQSISSGSTEYRKLMSVLTKSGLNLFEVIEFPDDYYLRFKNAVIGTAKSTYFFDTLDKCREFIINNNAGSNIVKYLLYRLNNKIIKKQFNNNACYRLSNLNLEWGCIPFDEMPFVTSPRKHNPRIYDLFDCIGIDNREHELLARHIKNNTENNGNLYTPIKDLESFGDVNKLIQSYNNRLYRKHKPLRDLELYKDHVYINGYEQDTVHIIEKLKELSSSGIKNYSNSVEAWLQSTSDNIDCEHKKQILKEMFESSKVALIYGAAGTGKTRLIEHTSNFLTEQNKLYLANTNPAINNLKSRIGTANSTFKTITSFLHTSNHNTDYDLLVIDECSTVSNSDMYNILEKASFNLIVLVGDVFQIESINFGNWFGVTEIFIPKSSVFELIKPYRSNNDELLTLWDKVRNIDDDVLEHITKNNYSEKLNDALFERSDDDEIILCLNYDGLYGINNINKFLQGNNKNPSVYWGVHTYKVGDPLLFNESNRFKPLIHNNLKGNIFGIEVVEDKIVFDIELDKIINELDTYGHELELLGQSENGKSVIRFSVNRLESTDEDNDSSRAIVPFQVAYVVSIHKAQGLEYNSVKIVITDEIEEMITHNIFYTAITRAKEKLKIYWSPETENKILNALESKFNGKDINLLRHKFDL